jgi:hypothetical protein
MEQGDAEARRLLLVWVVARSLSTFEKTATELLMTSRLTVLACIVAHTTSCLMAEPPDHEAPAVLPPVLSAIDAVPSATHLLVALPGDSILIDVPFRSSDGGDPVVALLYLNYSIAGVEVRQPPFYKASPSDWSDAQRRIRMEWRVPASGCMQLTLLATHLSNLDETGVVIDRSDASLLTWWILAASTDDTAVDMRSCSGL